MNRAINEANQAIGLRSFAEDLQSSNVPVVHYQWAPIAGGNQKLAAILKKLN
jgi:hypothetical protein